MTRDQRFATAYDSYFRHVYAYCRRRTELDRVDDAVADVFLTAWRRIDDMPDGRDTLLWLYGVAYKVVSHHWRSSNRKKKLNRKLEAMGAPVQQAADHLVVRRDEINQVLEAASRLSDADLEVLRLAVWEELSRDEIGGVLGISPNAVKQRLHRARRRLIREYQRTEGETPEWHPSEQGGRT